MRDTKGKDTQYLYFHMLAVPSDGNWDVREDCIYFRKSDVTPDYFFEDKLFFADKDL